MIIWSFKIDLKTLDVFDSISEKYGFEFPQDLRNFIIENNAASPDANCVDIHGVERVYDETLSFNTEEDEVTTFYSIADVVDIQKYIPFALDPFGNLFCYSITKGTIAFYEHEEDDMVDTDLDLNAFLNSLH